MSPSTCRSELGGQIARALALAALPLAAAGIAGCGSREDPRERPVLALVTASARGAFAEAARLVEAEADARVVVSPGPSSALARQVLEGAPADLLLAASEEWAAKVEADGLALDSRPLLGNALVLIAPRGNPARVRRLEDLLSPAVRRVALAGESVPAGKYAGEALRAAGVYEALAGSGRIARGHDVRSALAYVERGEAEAGVVYATDAKASSAVERVLDIDPRAHGPIVYPFVLVRRTDPHPAARRLFELLASPRALEVFERHGFTRVRRH
ncbi:MAG: molybdate ABC transporter substrate-binding protein [Planctomycetes bacterium]|nr:molybdate ABC transporter substrate-binding protein [Planctomycetota bacterium]